MRGAKYKFPHPGDCKHKEPAMLCPADRVIALYNQETGNSAKKIAKKVKEWFTNTAHEQGWSGVHFLPEVQSHHGAGALLAQAPDKVNKTIHVTPKTLILEEHTE